MGTKDLGERCSVLISAVRIAGSGGSAEEGGGADIGGITEEDGGRKVSTGGSEANFKK